MGEKSTQRRASPKGPHQPLLKMEDCLPIMVELEETYRFVLNTSVVLLV